jgi:hypothetical protein
VSSSAVPVADNGKNSYTAFSAVSLATTGGVRTTSRCSPGQLILVPMWRVVDRSFRNDLT